MFTHTHLHIICIYICSCTYIYICITSAYVHVTPESHPRCAESSPTNDIDPPPQAHHPGQKTAGRLLRLFSSDAKACERPWLRRGEAVGGHDRGEILGRKGAAA